MIGTVYLTHAARGVLCFIHDHKFLIPDYEVSNILYTRRKFLKGILAIHHLNFHKLTAIRTRYCQMRDGQKPEYLVNHNELEKELEIVCEELKDVTESYLKTNEKSFSKQTSQADNSIDHHGPAGLEVAWI